MNIVHKQDIEAAWRDVIQTSKIMLRSTDDTLLFAGVDTGRCSAEILVAPQANLDKNQRCTILHDQIDLAETTAIILRNRTEAMLLQMPGSPLFGLRTNH